MSLRPVLTEIHRLFCPELQIRTFAITSRLTEAGHNLEAVFSAPRTLFLLDPHW